jgi:hypothetical protein
MTSRRRRPAARPARASAAETLSRGVHVPDPNREELRRRMLEVVENQLRSNEPPETRATLDRLVAQGYSDSEAKRWIACVVVAEMFHVMKHQQPYNRSRFVAGLERLPQLPE